MMVNYFDKREKDFRQFFQAARVAGLPEREITKEEQKDEQD